MKLKSTKSVLFLICTIALLALFTAYSLIKNNVEEKIQASVESQLIQTLNELKNILETHSYLPSLMANNSGMIDFLRTEKTSSDYLEKQDNVNLSLDLTNNISGATTIFLMDPQGKVVASSNYWEEKGSLISKDFSLLPYFKQASHNALGRFFTIEPKTGEHFYFFSRSVQFENTIIGIITVKVSLSDISSEWIVPDIDFLITDENGVVFLSNKSSFNFKAISKVNQDQFAGNLRYQNKKIISLNSNEFNLNNEDFEIIHLLNQKYVMLSRKMELEGWHVRSLSKYENIDKEISRRMPIVGALVFLTALIALLLLNIQNQRSQFRKQAREELEQKVIERTKALKQSQEDLIQAAKMAALGQLSTGITHEINNPLTAIRSYADNAEQFLQKDRLDMVESNLKEISKLTVNMASITSQLKSFARKSKGELKTINIEDSIQNALSIIQPKIISSGTKIHVKNRSDNASSLVLADEIWLSQILLNLISNAISATKENSERMIWISTKETSIKDKKHYSIEVKDNGDGITETNLPRIFEPFFTTKSNTKGLGLGLSISFNLAKDMNGLLEARNHEKGGALFTLSLPMANTEKTQ